MKYIIHCSIFLFCAIHLTGLYIGLSAITTTLTLYIIAGYLSVLLVKAVFKKNKILVSNLTVFITSLLIFLFLTEAAIKYILKYNLSYSEMNGSYFYSSPYRSIKYQSIIKKYFYKQKDLHLYISRPNYVKSKVKTEFVYSRTYNSLGLRGPEPDTSKNKINIIALGDSYTEGVGVADDSTWFRQFIYMLNTQYSNCNYQGINSAISGSDLFFEYVKLEKLLLNFKPKFVILTINSSDIYDIHIRGGFDRFNKNGTVSYKPAPVWEPAYAASYIFRFFINNILKKDKHRLTGYINYSEKQKNIDSICSCIKNKYVPLALKNNFMLITVFHPTNTEINKTNELLSGCNFNSELQKNFLAIDLFKEWKNLIETTNIKTESIYYKTDGHHTPYGNFLFAKMMIKHFEENQHCEL